MTPPAKAERRWLGPTLLALVIAAALYLVVVVYATGELLLAGTLLVIAALAVWIYSAKATYAFRYLVPGIAAALVFVVFPMLYTITIGFTNYSSRNLLEFPRAEAYVLSDTFRAEGSSYEFSLHPATLLEVRRAIRGCGWNSPGSTSGRDARTRPMASWPACARRTSTRRSRCSRRRCSRANATTGAAPGPRWRASRRHRAMRS